MIGNRAAAGRPGRPYAAEAERATREWNVVVTVEKSEYREAIRNLRPFGDIAATDFYNVLVMRVADVTAFVRDLCNLMRKDATLLNCVSRIVPAAETFNYQSRAEFEARASAVMREWADAMADQSFYLRMHRRGFKGQLASRDEERLLSQVLIDRLAEEGRKIRVVFDNPDIIVVVETVGQRAGLSRWTRNERQTLPFLNVD